MEPTLHTKPNGSRRTTARRPLAWSIQAKLLALVVPLACLPMLIIVLISSSVTRTVDEWLARSRSAIQSVGGEARGVGERLARQLVDTEREQMLASAAHHVQMIETQVRHDDETLHAAAADEALARYFRGADDNQRQLQLQVLVPRLLALLAEHRLIEVRVLSPSGIELVRVAAEQQVDDTGFREELRNATRDESQSPWLRAMVATLAGGRPSFASVVADDDFVRDGDHPAYGLSPRPVIVLGTELRYSNQWRPVRGFGTVAGYLAFTVDLDLVVEHLRALRAKGWSAGLADAGGHEILGGNDLASGLADSGAGPAGFVPARLPVGGPGGAPLMAIDLRLDPARIAAATAEVRSLVGRIETEAGTAERSWQATHDLIDESGWRTRAAAGAMMAAAAVAAIWGARRAARRIQRLAAVADRLAAGDAVEPEAFGGGTDEIGSLARRLREMAAAIFARDGQIRAHALGLEAQVRERVRDLEARADELRHTAAESAGRARALEAANRRAEAAVRAKSQFLANTSHEIRTPMNGIIGLTREILKGEIDPHDRELAAKVLDCAESLMVIIDDILDFSKLEAGRVTVEQIPFDLHALLHAVTSTLRPAVERQGIEMHLEIEPGLSRWVIGDPTRVRQVVLNLAANAVKFTPQGGVRICVRRPAPTETPDDCEIAIIDSGIGIPADRLEAIFDEFTQADGSTSRRYGGTGLGLSISRRLATLLRGGLRVESTVGQGSTFTMRLPLPATERPVAAPAEAKVPAIALTREGRPLRVLVVDDNAVNRLVAVRVLASLGCRVTQAENGATALEKWSTDEVDIVLMDCQMPVMDGYETTRAIRAREGAARHTPIVALTANASEMDREPCFAAGMDGYLSKPFRPEQLLTAILAAAECDQVIKAR